MNRARGFAWCPHCKGPHALDARVCEATGRPIVASVHEQKPHPIAGAVINGKYRIVRHIGAGGMADVFEAENVRIGRRVAIKVMKDGRSAEPEALARFEREARLLAATHHPNICDVYDVGTMPDGTP